MNPSLKEERAKVSFNIEDLGAFYHGSKADRDFFIRILTILSEDPILKNDPSEHELSRKDSFILYAKKTKRIHELLNFPEMESIPHTHWAQQPLCTLHKYMFIPTIKYLGTEKQIEKFLEPALRMEILGCYGQTEMGHGSDVQSLETTATFDKTKDEFIMHSPTLTSTKWWPGEMGKVANYAVIHAQLYIEGKHYGVQTFVVPIRDLNTHMPFPGIHCGDIGPKLGYNTKDNGFLKFDHYCIPRENMLMRYCKVSKNGEFSKKGNDKMGYATMMGVRAGISEAAAEHLSMAVTIATRYSLVRTQFKNDDGKELKVLDYQTQMDKILPFIAQTYAMKQGVHHLRAMHNENMKRINEHQDFSLMQDLHAALSGCKAFYSWDTLQGIEICRLSCGGHGFSKYAGFVSLYTEWAPNCTHEGENTVMALQTARYLIKCLAKLRKGSELQDNVNYLTFINEILAVQKCDAKSPDDFTLDTLNKCIKANAAYLTYAAAQKIMAATSKGLSMKEAWNHKAGMDLVEAARAHTVCFTYRAFLHKVQALSGPVQVVTRKLCELYAVHKILANPLGLMECGYLSAEQFKMMKAKKEQLLAELRPEAVGLVDAFGFHDNSLKSVLGRYDGNVYDEMWDWVRNKNSFNKNEIIEGFEEYIKPMRNIKRPTPLTPKL